MRTLVFQAWVGPRPDFVGVCMNTVREWSSLQGFDYRLEGESMLQRIPEWFVEKVQRQIMPLSDLGRLQLAQGFLAQGYDRVIWIDADVVIFDPAGLAIDFNSGHAIGYEVWVTLGPKGIEYQHHVCNGFLVFHRGGSFLDFYADAILAIAGNNRMRSVIEFGPVLLTRLAETVPMRAMRAIGNLSPLVMNDLIQGGLQLVPTLMQQSAVALRGANLCTSKRGIPFDGITLTDADYATVLALLMDSRGQVLNRHLPAQN